MNPLVQVDQVEDVRGNPIRPVRRGLFSDMDVAREFVARFVGPYPRTAFRMAWQVQCDDGRWRVPGWAP